MAKKTNEQIIAEEEEKIRKARARIRKAKSAAADQERRERTHRLCECAGRIEELSGVEIDYRLATSLGKALKQWLAEENKVSAYVKERGNHARKDDLPKQN